MSVVEFLEAKGFRRMWITEESYSLVKVENNIIKNVGDHRLSDTIVKHLKHSGSKDELKKFYKSLILNKRYYIELLSYLNTKPIKDSKKKSYFFFSNCVVEITSKQIRKLAYKDIEGNVFKEQILNSRFSLTNKKSDFETFIENVSGSLENKLSLETMIGYLLHNYKAANNCPAIILTDLKKHKNQANGGTGKTLILDAISKLVDVAKIDGKVKRDRFKFSKVEDTTKIIYFDDVTPEFSFTDLFPAVTGDLEVEKKYKDAFDIPSQTSPKIVISSNYPVKSDGGSSDARRRVEFKLTDYYSLSRKPIDEFGKEFFNEWNDDEWNAFYNYMIRCQQAYFIHGIKEPQIPVGDKIAAQTSDDFNKLCDQLLIAGRNDKSLLFEKFKEAIPELSKKQFKRWLDVYSNHKALSYEHKYSGGKNYLIIHK